MELLILKTDDGYIRVKNGKYTLSSLDKASVFPMHKLPMVKEHRSKLISSSFKRPRIKQLILTEQPFEVD